MQIGCEIHNFDEWSNFDDRRILQMDGKTSATFWKDYKVVLLALCATRKGEDR